MLTITLTRNPRTNSKAVTGKITIPFDKFPLKENEQPYTGDTLENADFIIPAGTYPLDLTWSPKFKKLMPEVIDVPERTGIRIHMGTKPEHSEGCILVDYMTLEAVKAFINRIKKYTEDEEKICITIIDGISH
jgi:hypothetical protein